MGWTRSVALSLSMSLVPCSGLVACGPTAEVTPTIVISPGVKERIAVMDRLRHHGAPRRLHPRVTVEEVDEEDLPAAVDDVAPSDTPDEAASEPAAVDAGP